MSSQGEIVLSMDAVSKRFQRGELYDSLRDLIPAAMSSLLGRRRRSSGELRSREFWALQDISFDVRRGEAVGIIGSNGAGKSTLFKLLSGIMTPTKGAISVRGRLSALIEVGAGFHPDLTGRENIFLNGTILGMTKKEVQRKFDSIVDFSGLEQFIDTPVKRYSSGMYARLGFSVAVHVEPDVLIVDEVLSVGDYLFQQKCLDRMTEILKGGTTVLFVSHNLHAVSELCDRGILLEKGRMIADGPTDEVIRSYLGRIQEERVDDSAPVGIRETVLRDRSGRTARFQPGETAFVDVTLDARQDSKDVAVVVQIVDDKFYPIFDTCSARFSGVSASLSAREQLRCTFELQMHLGAGTYHVNVYAWEYAANRPFSVWRSAQTFFVGETRVLKGHTNLYPRLIACDVRGVVEEGSEAERRGAAGLRQASAGA